MISHGEAVKTVRREIEKNHGSIFLFPNNTGMAYQGRVEHGPAGRDEIILRNARRIRFGVPGSGGGPDLLGWKTAKNDTGKLYAVSMAVEVKTGQARRTKEQDNFARLFALSGGIYALARFSPGNEDPSYFSFESMSAFGLPATGTMLDVEDALNAIESYRSWFDFCAEEARAGR